MQGTAIATRLFCGLHPNEPVPSVRPLAASRLRHGCKQLADILCSGHHAWQAEDWKGWIVGVDAEACPHLRATGANSFRNSIKLARSASGEISLRRTRALAANRYGVASVVACVTAISFTRECKSVLDDTQRLLHGQGSRNDAAPRARQERRPRKSDAAWIIKPKAQGSQSHRMLIRGAVDGVEKRVDRGDAYIARGRRSSVGTSAQREK
jgi:hypothetical protein